jgi:hypoxanthine phosphoribosyltransferase
MTTTVALDVSWADLDDLTMRLASQIRDTGIPDVIVGVLRGGIVPAVMLAHRLGVRDVRAVAATRTLADGPSAAKTTIPLLTMPDSIGELHGLDVLVVDDVAGSGDTLRAVSSIVASHTLARLREAVLVVNVVNWVAGNPQQPDPCRVLNLIGTTCEGWVRFPWELS